MMIMMMMIMMIPSHFYPLHDLIPSFTTNTSYRTFRPLPVSLLASLEANLSQRHCHEQTDVPGDHVQPELVVEGWAGREVGHILADGGGEEPEQRLATKGTHTNIRGNEPAGGRGHQHGRVLLDPVGRVGISADDDGLPAEAGGGLGHESWGMGCGVWEGEWPGCR